MLKSDEINIKEIGERIRHLRDDILEVSQPKFGNRYHKNKYQLLYIEQGNVKNKENLIEFCKEVSKTEGISLDWLLYGTGEIYEQPTQAETPKEETVTMRRFDELGESLNGYNVADAPLSEIIRFFERNPQHQSTFLKALRQGDIGKLFEFLKTMI